MADIAAVFHWPPSEMSSFTLGELMDWREHARRRAGHGEGEK